MAVLTATKTWRRPTLAHPTRTPELSDEERAAVRRALVFLRVRAGSTVKLAEALGVGASVLWRAMGKNGKPGASLALRAARLLKQPIDLVLAGAFPPEGACAHCGRV